MRENWQIKVVTSTNHTGLKEFIKKNHYLKSLARGVFFTVILLDGEMIIGAACFGIPVGRNVKQKYSPNSSILELKRFVLKDCPKNTASWLMSRAITWIKRNTIHRTIITYADPQQGHEGIIYKASNFTYLGVQQYKNAVYKIKGSRKKIHLRAAYQRGTATAKFVKEGLKNGTVKRVELEPKHVFIYKVAA